MAQPVISRGQLLAVLVERCPRCLQPVFDLVCFFILERDFLTKVPRTVSFCQDFDSDVFHCDLFCFHFVMIAEYFVLSG